jgi:hypothetical protein
MGRKWFQSGLPKPDGGNGRLAGPRQVQRGTIDHINQISATRMTLVPTPIRNNPASACMSHPVGHQLSRSHSTFPAHVERLGLGICCLQRERGHLYLLYWSKVRLQSSAAILNPNRARPPATTRPAQLSDFGTDQSPIMIDQSSKIRIRWNRATKVKIAPATVENVLRFIERPYQAGAQPS